MIPVYKLNFYSCKDGMCGAEDCFICHPEIKYEHLPESDDENEIEEIPA